MTGRILFVLTSHDSLGDTGRRTGFYVPELAHPLSIITEAGYAADFVSPAGGAPPRDGGNRTDPVVAAFFDDTALHARIDASRRPEEVDASQYDAIFFVGGHGTMWDLPTTPSLATLTAQIYDRGGVVAAVCHGPAGLVNVRLGNGAHLVDGKRVAAFTNAEEDAVGLTQVVPFLLQDQLRAHGAIVVTAPNFTANVIVSDRLVTGQNPASAAGVATEMLKLLAPLPSAVA
jgi:putative intracellular protease/amidase